MAVLNTAQPCQKRHLGGTEAVPVGKNEALQVAAVPAKFVAPITVAFVNASLAEVDPYVPSTGVVKGRNIPSESFIATPWPEIRW